MTPAAMPAAAMPAARPGRVTLTALMTAMAAIALAGCANLTPVSLDPALTRLPTAGLLPDAAQAPAMAATAAAPAGEAGAQAAPAADELHWWRRFDDPALAGWVDAALQGNVDAALAAERVQQAQALLRSAQAQGGVRLGVQADTTLQLRPRGDERRVQPGASIDLELQPDLWGGLALAQRSAAAGVLRSLDLAQAARLAAAGLAARAYIDWRLALQDQALLAQAEDLQAEALRIVQVRVQAGLSPLLDRERAQAQLAATQAERAAAATRAQLAGAALQVLAGQRPQAAGLSSAGAAAQTLPPPLPQFRGPTAQGRPLDLLRQRPDLRAAEQALLAAAADVGVAQAALRPRLRLPGSLVFGTLAGGGALELVSATVAAALDLRLLDGGAGAAGVQAAQSRAHQASLLYRQTLLQALQQVDAAGTQAVGAQARIEARERGSAASRQAEAQAQTLYRAGLTGFGDVIDAQRTALDNQRALLQARADAATAAVNLFEALGWVPPVAGAGQGDAAAGATGAAGAAAAAPRPRPAGPV